MLDCQILSTSDVYKYIYRLQLPCCSYCLQGIINQKLQLESSLQEVCLFVLFCAFSLLHFYGILLAIVCLMAQCAVELGKRDRGREGERVKETEADENLEKFSFRLSDC